MLGCVWILGGRMLLRDVGRRLDRGFRNSHFVASVHGRNCHVRNHQRMAGRSLDVCACEAAASHSPRAGKISVRRPWLLSESIVAKEQEGETESAGDESPAQNRNAILKTDCWTDIWLLGG